MSQLARNPTFTGQKLSQVEKEQINLLERTMATAKVPTFNAWLFKKYWFRKDGQSRL